MKARQDLDGRFDDREHDGAGGGARPAPGRVTLTSRLSSSRDVEFGGLMPVQMHDATAPRTETHEDPFALHLIASRGVAGGGAPLPYLDELKPSFGRHAGVLDGATAHVGGAAADAASQIGAQAFTTGNRIGFASAPDRALAGHEAAHLVQQAGGVQLKGGVGEAGDPYERHADEVGAAFARGESVEALLDDHAGTASADGVAGKPAPDRLQRKPGDWAKHGADALTLSPLDELWKLVTGESMSLVGGIRKQLGKTAEGVLLGGQRTAEGLGLAGEDRMVEIGEENSNFVDMIGKVIGHGPTWLLERLAATATVYAVGKMMRTLSPEERVRLHQAVSKNVTEKVAGAALEFAIAAAIKKRLITEIAKIIAGTEAYQAMASALKVSPGAGAAGAGVVVSMLQAQGLLQRASNARQVCRADHPELFAMMSRDGIDMAAFLIAPHLTLLDIAVRTHAFAIQLTDAGW